MNTIDRLEGMTEKAPRTPWKRDDGCWPDYIVDAANLNIAAEVQSDDADFIIAAVNALPDLLKLARAVQAAQPQRDPRHRVSMLANDWYAITAAGEPLFREDPS